MVQCTTTFAAAPFDSNSVYVDSISAPAEADDGSIVTADAVVVNDNLDTRAFLDVEWTRNGSRVSVDSHSISAGGSITISKSVTVSGDTTICCEVIAAVPDDGPTPQ